MKKTNFYKQICIIILTLSTILTGCTKSNDVKSSKLSNEITITLDTIPSYSGNPYIVINNNKPYFSNDEITDQSFEFYSDLDSLGRCQYSVASIGQDLMPKEKRGSIGQVKPSGWNTVKYDTVDGKYLYNRCHLIGYQLTAENANTKNLITGTRYLNIEGMLPFENMVADYVKETNYHVMYRVTPIFKDDELVARGVLMEGYSVEDQGEGIEFCIYAYNVQPNVNIDYKTGKSSSQSSSTATNETKEETYILNTNTKKFHKSSCSSVKEIDNQNKKEFHGSRKDLIKENYKPCNKCKP